MATDLEGLIKDLESQGAPRREFWENDLEMAVGPALRTASEEGGTDKWLARRTGRQTSVLLPLLLGKAVETSARKRKAVLRSGDVKVLPYVLVEEFSRFKSNVAVADVAKSRLKANALQSCQIGEAGESFDKVALLFALYAENPESLAFVFHLDKVHKSGFARMKLKGNHRRPTRTLHEAMDQEAVHRVLAAFDQSRRDRLATELKGLDQSDGRLRMFIRRPERPEHILEDRRVVHGYRPEWIILDFEEGAKRVHIASHSTDVPLEIANRIATSYYSAPCEYENESNTVFPKQVEVLLSDLAAGKDAELALVEIVVAHSPLNGSPKLKISDEGSRSIGPALDHFRIAIGSLVSPVKRIESVKVLYRKKRVSLILEPDEDGTEGCVVRYSDHRLNGFERREFETHMRDVHEIPILSTEKRFKR